MQIKQFYFLSLIFFLLFSCKKTVKITIPDTVDGLVVNGLLFKDSILNIHVRKTQPILGDLDTNAINEVKNAKVKLYEDNSLIDSALYRSYIDTFHYSKWFRAPRKNSEPFVSPVLKDFAVIQKVEGYVFPHYIPKAGTHYKVEVSAPDYPTATAETYMPSAPKVSNVQVQLHANIQDLYSQSYLSFDLEDNPNEKNHYFVKVRGRWHWGNFWNNNIWSELPVDWEEQWGNYGIQQMPIFGDNNYLPVLSGDINTTKTRDYVIVKDTDFNGQKKQINLMLRTNYKRKSNNVRFEYTRFTVSVYSVSEEYFAYMEKFNLVKKLGLDLGVLDATPVTMPNSVKNGYGLLGGYVVTKDSLTW